MTGDTEALPRTLTERERGILNFLLNAEFQGAAALRAQAETAKVTALCGCGCASIHLEVDRDRSPRAELMSRIPVEASGKAVEDGGLILFADEGWLSYLEIWYVTDEPPPEFPPPSRFDPPRPN